MQFGFHFTLSHSVPKASEEGGVSSVLQDTSGPL